MVYLTNGTPVSAWSVTDGTKLAQLDFSGRDVVDYVELEVGCGGWI
jgi:hypothetical protein